MQTIYSPRLTLAPYSEPLRASFVNWMLDPQIESFLCRSFPHMPRGDQLFAAFVDRCSEQSPSSMVWAITIDPGPTLVGHLECKESPKTGENELELIYAIRKTYRGNGFATEAVDTVAERLATSGKCLVGFINPNNAASRNVLANARFHCVPAAVSSQGEKWRNESPCPLY